MSANEELAPAPPKRARGGRSGLVAFLVVMVALIVGAAYYQEELTFFFSLRAWDRQAPAHTVATFLKAGAAGDKEGADRCLDVSQFEPLQEGGKFVGYQVPTTVGRLQYRFNELSGSGEPRAEKSEFIFKGRGAAMVTVPDAAGRPIDYRLAMQEGGWKITEIRGGTVAK
jgi:hypothetical protein